MGVGHGSAPPSPVGDYLGVSVALRSPHGHQSAGVDDSTTIFLGQFQWRVGKTRKWSISGQYFTIDADGQGTLNEDLHWQDITFPEGTTVGAGVEVEIARIFVGYSFDFDEQTDIGIGAGLHNLKISSFVEGVVPVDDERIAMHDR